MATNVEIKKTISKIKNETVQANNKNDLLTLLDEVISLNYPLKYNNKLQWIIGLLGLLTAVGYLIYQDKVMPYTSEQDFVTPSVLAFIGVGFIIFGCFRVKSVSALADDIFAKTLLFDNQLTPKAVDGKHYAKQLKQSFLEFNRGNYSRKIESLTQGEYSGEQYQFTYEYYVLQYVDERTETTTDTDEKGNTTTETHTVYDYYHRYGILVDFPYAVSLAIYNKALCRHHAKKYQPASIHFNKRYKVTCQDEMVAAKFLRPATVIKFEDMYSSFSKLNFEVNAQGRACISIDEHLLDKKRQYGLDNLAKFRDEIAKKNEFKKLSELLAFSHYLMTQSDSNF